MTDNLGRKIDVDQQSAKVQIGFQDLLVKPWHFVALGFGSGLSPYAPGTCGSLLALVFVPLLLICPWWLSLLLIASSFIFGIWLCAKVANELNSKDPGCIVWDEFVGIWITYFITIIFTPLNVFSLLLGFCLFRIFDALKPFPVSYCDQNVSGGLGIMLDDLVAGVLAAMINVSVIRLYLLFV